MYMLVLQTFLMMLGAFVLGAALACAFKRSLHRFAGDELPEDALHVDVPPAVHRSAAVAAAATAAPVVVTRAEAQRFERALTGDVAEAPLEQSRVRQAGPVIEVQPLPVPPPPPPAPEARAYVEEVPPQAEPEPDAPIDIPLVSREDDAAAAGPQTSYVAEALAAGGGALAAGETYNAIAVASHDGSMLEPPAIVEAELPPPQMPGPTPEALPVPRVAIPTPQRPEDAPEPPHQTYIDEALAAGAVYVPEPEPSEVEFELPVPADPDDFSIPPEGQTYASVALGGADAPAAAAPVSPEPEPALEDERVIETKPTHVATALAAAAGIAAERAAGAGGAAGADDLTRIQGIDQVLAERLNYAGVTRFAEIANWNGDDVRRMSQALGFFGRIQDEYWIDQARLLAGGAQDAPPPAAEAPRNATPAGAADIATAAAAAAAAAMVASYSRPAPDTPSRPAKLADAIRENSESPEHAGSAAKDFAGEAEDFADEDVAEAGSRSGLTGLRSVRAEALLGDDADFVRGALDDLKRIRGIGVLIEKKLNSLGITSYEQVANWSASDVERISEVLDFKGRIERENWIEQARILASGGQTEFSRRVDRGEV